VCLSFDLSLGLLAPTWPTRLGLIRSLSAEADVTPHSAAATSDLTQADAFRVHPFDGRTTAMVMLADEYDFVIGGDPDRDTVDLAVLDTGAGPVRAHLADTADGAGYRRMLAWADEHSPGRRIWALEGTGSFAAGLVVFLLDAGETVVEVGALKRARGAKSDRIDAIRAARQALSRDEQGAPRAGGLREALRMVFACREGVLVSRTKAINELKSLIVVAPEQLRAQLRGRSLTAQAGTDRGTADPGRSTHRAPAVRVHSAVNCGPDPVPVCPARRTRSPTA